MIDSPAPTIVNILSVAVTEATAALVEFERVKAPSVTEPPWYVIVICSSLLAVVTVTSSTVIAAWLALSLTVSIKVTILESR